MNYKKKRTGMKKGIALLPNLITTANLFCGFFAIINGIKGNYTFACWLVVLAGIFDSMDGRVARMTNTQSDFGIEYDSLSDLTTFGMAPAILMYNWALSGLGKLGIAACFLYFSCGALRLARFNVQAHSVEKTDFQGLPSPAAAGTLISFIMFHTYFFGEENIHPLLTLGLVSFVGLLMVSNVRYRSMKKFNTKGNFLYLIAVVALLFLIASKPEVTLFIFGISYISMGLIEWVWKSPKKIRGVKDYIKSIYEDNNYRFEKKRRKKRNLKKNPDHNLSTLSSEEEENRNLLH